MNLSDKWYLDHLNRIWTFLRDESSHARTLGRGMLYELQWIMQDTDDPRKDEVDLLAKMIMGEI